MSSVVNLSGPLPAPSQEANPLPPASAERDARGRPHSRQHLASGPVHAAPPNPFLPMLMVALSVLGWLGFQAHQLMTERQALQAAHASQQQTVDSAAKLRASLDSLAADTQRLADAGNPAARNLVDELKKRGVTINMATASSGSATGTR